MFTDGRITLDHGAGGTTMRGLIQDVFLKSFDNAELSALADGAKLSLPSSQIVFTTDSYVVQPLVFPGGDLGKLAVCGTVNDLLVMGARPLYLSLGLIIEEGLPLELLKQICSSIAQTASAASVAIVTGDTKVVPRGQCDQLFINTSGIGSLPLGNGLSPEPIKTGDAIIVSGTLGDHAMAILSVRNGLTVSHKLESDCAPLVELVGSMLTQHGGVKWMRDATRGGVAAVLDELSTGFQCRLEIHETRIPSADATRAICELLGFDPIHLANEGKIVAVVARDQADAIVNTMRATEHGAHAAIIGEVIGQGKAGVRVVTASGGTRKLQRPSGELLPRIC
ncbi:MAG: hydrogenase expression/formation protein HypE [bacterium]|nr:hydrogenase expression/formation protein HypE [bacterium]